MSPGLRTLLYAVFVLGVLLGYLPWQARQIDLILGKHVGTFLTYSGGILFVAGALLLFSGAYYLVLRGEGTPLPFDAPKRLVVAGPYARIQHPMALGLFSMAFAEALWFQSPSLGIYAVLLTILGHFYLIYIEEPGLERRFGEDYRAYRAAVPRWLPFSRPPSEPQPAGTSHN
ncbi:MAG: isoprenylcysteine carboxylmethyltransferase family protein [Deltaproteobacteria bacterium]|nr:isoprenylcysteine carboxylmethyltransferase family protein [Deltaproteobacteria bacterium]